jgi:hypothetical protein
VPHVVWLARALLDNIVIITGVAKAIPPARCKKRLRDSSGLIEEVLVFSLTIAPLALIGLFGTTTVGHPPLECKMR